MGEERQEAAGRMTGPGAEHRGLEPFVGEFRAEVKIWVGPGEPVASAGTMVGEWDLGGLYLRQTYTGDPSEGPFSSFEGRGYWGFNTVTRRYEGFWIDNASTLMQTETGSVDEAGKVWTMTGEMANPQTGGMMKKRSVITVDDADHHRMETYFDTGGGEVKALEIRYQRAT